MSESTLCATVARYIPSPEGRKKLYASLRYPLLVKLQYHKIDPAYDLMPEEVLWALLEAQALETGKDPAEVFVGLLDTEIDPAAVPPHPFVYYRGGPQTSGSENGIS